MKATLSGGFRLFYVSVILLLMDSTQNTEEEPKNNIQTHNLDVNSIYPEFPQRGSTPQSFNTQQNNTGTDRKLPNKKIILGSSLVLCLILGVVFLKAYQNYKQVDPDKPPTYVSKSVNSSNSGPTIEKKLSKDQLAVLKSIPYSAYVPSSQAIAIPILSYDPDSPEKMYLAYSVNPSYGNGLIKGSYGYSISPKSPNFNPPSNCGLPGQQEIQVKCSLYAGSDKNLLAYVYNGGTGITYVAPDGKMAQKITMYSQIDNMVMTIETSDTDPSELYSLLKDMKKVKLTQLPDTTTVNFYSAKQQKYIR
jgi:hypothetical protein